MNTPFEDTLRQALRSSDLDADVDVTALLAGMRRDVVRRDRHIAAGLASAVLVVGVALGAVALGQGPRTTQPATSPTDGTVVTSTVSNVSTSPTPTPDRFGNVLYDTDGRTRLLPGDRNYPANASAGASPH